MFHFGDLQRELKPENRAKWEELWYELLRADLPAAGLTTQDLHWDHRADVPDGGRDVTIAQGSQTGKQPLIPEVPSIWSVKSGTDGTRPTTLTQEIERHPPILDALRAGRKYFYCVCTGCTAEQRDKLAERATELERSSGLAAHSIELLHADHLVAHLKRHIGVVKRLFPALGSSLGATLSQWGRSQKPLFDPTISFVDLDGRAEVFRTLVDHLNRASRGPLLHVAGLSGIGKTRLAYEACLRSDVAGEVLYYPSFPAAGPILARLDDDAQLTCTIVIDECSLNEMTVLGSRLEAHASRVRAISVGPASAGDASRAGVIVIPTPGSGAVQSVLASYCGASVSPDILRLVAEHSAHDIRFALMLGELVRTDPQLALNPTQLVGTLSNPTFVFSRIIRLFQENLGDESTFLARYRWLTLGRQVGWKAPRREELIYLAQIAESSEVSFDDLIEKARRAGLGEAPAHLFEAVPRGLATLIFSKELWPIIIPRFDAIFGGASESFRLAMMQRVELCQQGLREEVRSRVDQYFLRTLGEPDLAVLGERAAARTVRAWAELSPAAGLAWLDRAVEESSADTLRQFTGTSGVLFGSTGPRREIIWAVSHLACFAEHYSACENILFRLALAENEKISNNATSEWLEKHRIVLSNTQMPYPGRMDVLFRRFERAEPSAVPLLLSGFVQAITIPYAALAPPAVVGGKLVPPEWRPTSHPHEIIVATIKRGIAAVDRWDQSLGAIASDQFIQNFDVLCGERTLPELKQFLRGEAMSASQRDALRLAIENSRAMHQRAGDAGRSRLIADLEQWLSDLAPRSDAESIRAAVGRRPWEFDDHHAHSKGVGGDAWRAAYGDAARRLVASPGLLLELEDWFDQQPSESCHALGVTLAQSTPGPVVESALELAMRRQRLVNLCTGFCVGYRDVHGALPAWTVHLLDEMESTEPEYTGRITCSVDPTERGLERVLRCAQRLGADRARVLGRLYGHAWGSILTASRQATVLAALREAPGFPLNAEQALIHLARMYTSGQDMKPLQEPLLSELRYIVEHPPFRSGTHAEHDWRALAVLVARSDAESVLRVSIRLAVFWTETRAFANQEAVSVLAVLAQEPDLDVLTPLMDALREAPTPPSFHLEAWQSLFSQFSAVAVEKAAVSRGRELVRHLGRLVPDPVVRAGEVQVPQLTAWYLETFGTDEECLREFDIGRWSGRLQSGPAWERLVDAEKDAGAYDASPISALRRWSSMRLDRLRRAAVRDRIEHEDIDKRG